MDGRARRRAQLRLHLARMRAMGRSLLLQRELVVERALARPSADPRESLPPPRWTAANWQRIQAQMPPWVIAQLALWKKIIAVTEGELAALEATLAGAAPKQLFVGEGELSHELIARELLDPHRFKNGRQVGNYFGLCPSESSSGEKRRLGAITKHGSPRLRRLMIQLAWRCSPIHRPPLVPSAASVVIFQPQYRGMQRWQSVLGLGVAKTSGAARKKAIVALARQLGSPIFLPPLVPGTASSAVDLWRIATGRIKAEAVGLGLRPNA